jgi:predicted transcriptional regulator
MRAKQSPSAVALLSTLGNVPVSRAMETQFYSLLPHDYLRQAVVFTLAGSQQDFPVVENARLVGMLPQADLFMALKGGEDRIRVAEVMRREFPVVNFNERIEDALNRLRSSGIHTLPVTDQNRLVGLLTMENAQEFLEIEWTRRTHSGGVPLADCCASSRRSKLVFSFQSSVLPKLHNVATPFKTVIPSGARNLLCRCDENSRFRAPYPRTAYGRQCR